MKLYVRGSLKTYRISKNTILSKPIMLAVIGWRYGWKGYNPDDNWKSKESKQCGYWAINERAEKVLIGKTMKEADSFCFEKYKEYYYSHHEEQEYLPDPRKRKKVVSKIVTIYVGDM